MPNNPLLPPFMRPDLPTYPVHMQLLRVTATQVTGPSGFAQVAGSSVLGPMLYVSFVQQMRDDGSLLPRDREPCLVDSVNGIPLTPGFYLGRLASSFNSLPVYEVIAVGVSNTYVSGTTTTWLPGSFISNDATEQFTPNYNGTYSGGVSVTFNQGSTLTAGGILQTGAGTATIVGTTNSFSNPQTPQVTITSATGTPTLNGIVPPTDTTRAQTITLVNNSGSSITVNNNSGSAISGGAITTGTGAAVTWATGTSLQLQYDPTVGGYVVVGGTGVSGSGTVGTNYPGWVKYTVSYTDLAAASTSSNFIFATLAAKTFINAAVIKTSTSFSGGAIASYSGSVAFESSGQVALSSYDMKAAVSDTNFGYITDSPYSGKPYNFGSTTSVYLNATTVGANTNAATQGSADIWLLQSVLP